MIALARLAAEGLAVELNSLTIEDLMPEAQTILFTARQRGVISIRGNNQAFDSVDRFLSVFVETGSDQQIRFGSKESPRQSVLCCSSQEFDARRRCRKFLGRARRVVR